MSDDYSDVKDENEEAYEEDSGLANAIKADPENLDESDFDGSAPNPEITETRSVADEAHQAGLYNKDNDDGKDIEEVSVADQITKAEEAHKKD